jgi:glycosyltransferase involved in cell wall biosynthesis
LSELVSIIIPCFDSERFVGEAIQSALAQTYPRTEVVVVDDGSTDGSLEVIRSFGDRIRWESGPNRGACAARNRGLALARGRYIQFLDSDDLLHPEKVAKQLPLLEANKRALIYSLHTVVSMDPKSISAMNWNRGDDAEDAVVFMFRGDLPTPAPLHHRRNVEAIGGFREDLPCAQDRDFHFRLALSGIRFVPLGEPLFTIRRRAGSLGTSNPSRIDEYRGRIAIEVWNTLIERGDAAEVRAIECAAMLTRGARKLWLFNPSLASRFAAEAKRIHPTGGEHLAYSRSLRLIKAILGYRNAERFRGATSELRRVVCPAGSWRR